MNTIEHWIDGTATPAGSTRTAPVYDPATGQRQARVLLAEPSDVDTAVSAAAKAFESWGNSSLSQRTKVMFAFRELLVRHEDELAGIISAEHGKVIEDARGEIVRGREVVEYACGIADALKGSFSDQVSRDVDVHDFRQPLGVVAGITPFNFPIMVPLWMHPIAIATGNTFVLKPSERDPSASNFVARLYSEAGLPDGVFNVVHGDKVAVDAILDHPQIAAVSFVGSTPIAKYVHERGTAAGKRVQALGGAKNHAVVLPDADLEFAADHLTAAAFGSAGQRCMAISVGVAVGSAGDRLVEILQRKAAEVKVGPGTDPASDMGPLVTEAARERVEQSVARGAEQGAKVVVDGRGLKVEGHEEGFFVGPSLLDEVTPEMDAYRDEIFGPVLSIIRAATLDEAIEVINTNPYGNGTAVFTASGEAARKFQREVKVGMIGVNVPIPVPMSYYSFGGWKDSLIGESPIHGPAGTRFYTRAKVVTTRWPHTEAAFNFPTAT
ncbi:CoA-acylating methylmalonate-semialdehyde dehydrogenase [Amycolatopsis sp. NPDC004169]|uniref:CoA-acylating methylmalonate-semialdehyde dehydrogenase n=1 Tax=Amycolatopsis sp. NPDC004169 TaxID=3154453 RepID=UPI0033A0073D